MKHIYTYIHTHTHISITHTLHHQRQHNHTQCKYDWQLQDQHQKLRINQSQKRNTQSKWNPESKKLRTHRMSNMKNKIGYPLPKKMKRKQSYDEKIDPVSTTTCSSFVFRSRHLKMVVASTISVRGFLYTTLVCRLWSAVLAVSCGGVGWWCGLRRRWGARFMAYSGRTVSAFVHSILSRRDY